MLDPKQRIEHEQQLALMGELLPRMWATLFRGCLTEGFSCVQAIGLVETYILASCGTNISPPPPTDQKTNTE